MATTSTILALTPCLRQEPDPNCIFQPEPARLCTEHASLIHAGVTLVNHAKALPDTLGAWTEVATASYEISGPCDRLCCTVSTDTHVPIYFRVFLHTKQGRRRERLKVINVLVSDHPPARHIQVGILPDTVRVAFSILPMEPEQQVETDGATVEIRQVELLPKSVF